jgi:dihydrofolate synthase/folylpolyglutamate synthase
MAFAYYVFAQENVDYAIIETGLGGLLDGSNVAEREDKICVIQRIGYDHTEILGSTLQEIALQKAGIIHEKNTVFVLEQSDDINTVIADYAMSKHASLHKVHESHVEGLPVSYQQANWSMAYAVYDYLVKHEGVEAVAESNLALIKQQTPPGRYEIHSYKDRTVIFDGAHNGQKLSALMDSMNKEGVDRPLIVLSLKETDKKKIEECLAAVAGHCQELVITTFNAGQDSRNITNADTNIMQQIASSLGVTATVMDDQSEAFEYAVTHASSVILVTGSLYLVSEMRQLIVS